MEKDPKGKKFVPEDYHDESRPNLKFINFGLWLTENRRRIIKVAIALLILSTIGFFVYSAYGFLYYFLVGRDQDKSLTDNFADIGINLQDAHLRNTAIPLTFSSPMSFVHGDKVDLAVKIKNSNEKFSVTFDYCFITSGVDFACGTDFLLPNDEKFVLSLAQSGGAQSYQFVLKRISWKKIDNRKYPNWPDFYQKRINFVVSNVNFQSSPNGSSNTLSFSIENKSPYNYWELPLNIVLNSGGGPVAVNRFVLSDFKSLEKRTVNLSWPEHLPMVQAEIMPDLDILNDGIYRLE